MTDQNQPNTTTLPEDIRSFVKSVTLHLQSSRSKEAFQHDAMFHEAYKLYVKYDVEGRNTLTNLTDQAVANAPANPRQEGGSK